MTDRQTPATTASRRRISAALGAVAGVLLAVSAFLPYWQARLFAPQYREGLTMTMYLHKLTGDIQEIDILNHYVGVAKLGSLAVWERRLALPGLAVLVALCLLAFRKVPPLPAWLKVLPVAAFPLIFMADMKFWMHQASTDLDPMAPLKLKPFVIPLFGTGKVGQFRSELGPGLGFILALVAVALLLEALWLSREAGLPGAPATAGTAGLPARQDRGRGKLAGLVLLLLVWGAAAGRAEPLQPLLDAAAPGSVVELAGGRFEGPAVIDKRLTLRGRGAVIDARGSGTVLTVKAPGVLLEGLTLRRSGASLLEEDAGLTVIAASVTARGLLLEDVLFGVFASNAPGFVLEDSRLAGKPLDVGRRGDLIRIWNCDRVRLSRNRVTGGRDMVLWFSTGSVVEGNVATQGRYGLHFMHTDGARVVGNEFRDNSVGLYVMYSKDLQIVDNLFERHRGPSGSGLGLKESDLIDARGNVFRDNRQGIFVDQSPVVEENANAFRGNLFAYNDVALALMPGVRGNVFEGNAFEDNLQQVSVRGGGVPSGNDWTGNYWSDYAGYGRGERGHAPYRAERVVERLADARPLARFFLYTPAAQAIELAARTFPLFKPKPLVTDPSPLLRAPRRDAGPRPEPALAALWMPASLLSASALAVGWSRRRRRPILSARAALPEAAPAVWAAGVAKAYGDRKLLRDLSFSAAPGECLVLWGSNGAGKSTLMRCLLGLESFAGKILVGGVDVSREGPRARERVGYLSQEFAGYDWTVRRSMEFVCEVRGCDPGGIGPALERCGLAGEEEKLVPALSGGMKQKLALAQALVADPDILLLDEPCSSLDLKSRRELTAILVGLKGTRTLVMTSHHLDEVAALADRVLWLDEAGPARLLKAGQFLEEIDGEGA
ncbi:MAG: nitrous oxide reductase family maturation protein NosD [Elusimicrobia bacterium]|nr:nitrous oxide reductase family maturation protein NosD [Elusimicrobiota bacterium]